jgi:hypothetical protein
MSSERTSDKTTKVADNRSIGTKNKSSTSQHTPQHVFINTMIKKLDSLSMCATTENLNYNHTTNESYNNPLVLDRVFVIANAHAPRMPIVYCNEAFCELTIFKRHEILQQPCDCPFLHGPMTQRISVAKLNKAFKSEIETHVKLWLYRSDGNCFQCSIIVTPVRNAELCLFILIFEEIHGANKVTKGNNSTLFQIQFSPVHVMTMNEFSGILHHLIDLPFLISNTAVQTPKPPIESSKSISASPSPVHTPLLSAPPKIEDDAFIISPVASPTNDTSVTVNESDHFSKADSLFTRVQRMSRKSMMSMKSTKLLRTADTTNSPKPKLRTDSESSSSKPLGAKGLLEKQIRKELTNLKSSGIVPQIFTFTEGLYPEQGSSDSIQRPLFLIMHYSTFKGIILLLLFIVSDYAIFLI